MTDDRQWPDHYGPSATDGSRFAAVAELPLTVETVDLVINERETAAFTRKTTTIAIRGAGETGMGEDVTYEGEAHEAFAAAGPPDLTGEFTLGSFSAHLDAVELWPAGPPGRDAFRHYRRWGIESAALDLALRQAGTDLASALSASLDPVRFVVSPGLGDPPTTARLEALRDRHADLEFKLDAEPAWTGELIAAIADLGGVRVVDLKGQYADEASVDQPADPDLYRRVAEAFPDAILEDPKVTEGTRPVLDPVADRVSWDAPLHAVSDLETFPWPPAVLNCKPSRFGTVRSLLDFVDHCAAAGIALYGGGQFELDVGRGQIQLLASLFHPDAPNDVAPRGYNDVALDADLPGSPLEPPEAPVGFRWE